MKEGITQETLEDWWAKLNIHETPEELQILPTLKGLYSTGALYQGMWKLLDIILTDAEKMKGCHRFNEVVK